MAVKVTFEVSAGQLAAVLLKVISVGGSSAGTFTGTVANVHPLASRTVIV